MALGKRTVAIVVTLALGVQIALGACGFSQRCSEEERAASISDFGNRKLLSDSSAFQRGGSGDAIEELVADESSELPITTGPRELLTAKTCSVTIQAVVPFPRCLHVAEVKLYDPSGNPITPTGASLSSTLPPFYAQRCIDGDENTFCHSRNEPSPSLTVSYPCPTECSGSLSKVTIVNRKDCCQTRLKGYGIWFTNPSGQVDRPVYIIRDTGSVYTIPLTKPGDYAVEYVEPTPPTCAVVIKLRDANCNAYWDESKYLLLAELELFDSSGQPIPSSSILPSPVLDLGCEYLALDKRYDTVCGSRQYDLDPQFIVAYPCPSGKSSSLSKVVITTDKSQPQKISNFVLQFLDSTGASDQPIQNFQNAVTNTFLVKQNQ